MSEKEEGKLNINQQRFIEEYCSNGYNATQAALTAGYSDKTAASQGQRLLKNVEISNAIKARLDELTLTAEQLTKRMADIAMGDLSNYMTTRMIEYTPRVRKSLRDIISELEFNLILQEEFCAEKGYTEEQYDDFQRTVVEPIQDKILKYSIELKHNPNATRLVNGETELVPHIEVDMPKLLADKERGIIKSFKYGKNGLEVELYPADAAMDKLMRVKGMYKDKLDITTKDQSLNEKVSPEEAQRLLKQLSGGNFNVEEG
ncbi:terminase small subunit [Sphingobacterium sp. Lzh-3]|uniref:terminase small subunit n=1 Tax=Sphingobacterium sp. Lzh-3 TaxID=3382150 RepID=UPI00398CF000